MKEIRNQKAITLVALIITIIVLLILAVVAIRAVQGEGIIGHAKNARDNYNRAQITENGTIQNYTDYINSQLENKTKSIIINGVKFTLEDLMKSGLENIEARYNMSLANFCEFMEAHSDAKYAFEGSSEGGLYYNGRIDKLGS